MVLDNLKCILLKIECASGFFGLDCKGRCSGHCINNEPCNHVSGMCTSGCQDGYTENNCNRCKKFAQSLFLC